MNENGIILSDDVIIEIVHGIRDVLIELVKCLQAAKSNEDSYSELYFQDSLKKD